MSDDVQGFRLAIERLDQIAEDLGTTTRELGEGSSEIKNIRATFDKLDIDIRADVTALQTANTRKEELLRAEQKLATTKESATNVLELTKQLKFNVGLEVRDGLRRQWQLTLGLTAAVVVHFGWMYFHDPASKRTKELEERVRQQERLAALEQYVQPDEKGGWKVQIEKGSIFRGTDGQTYARLPKR